ncbi:MAG TPA: thiol peroxidase [Anaerolineales bacterium]
MSIVRKGLFEFRGQDAPVVGADIQVNQQAPEFTVQGMDWSLFRGMGDTQGKVRIIGSLPSLSTSVCDRETRRFNQEAAALGEDIVIMMVSMDLPYTIKNWCGAAGVDRVVTVSDHLSGEFGEKYGVLLKDQRIFRRAIFVVDRNGKVVYAEYMPKMGDEPNYEQVLTVAKDVL